MVKVQKPIPKKIGNKPKLENPIKTKKQQLNKGKSTGSVKNIKAKLLDSPIKEAKITNKTMKEVPQKKQDKKNPKGTQKEAVEPKPKHVDPVAPQKDKPKGKKNKGKDTGVKNGHTKIAKPTLVKSVVPEKIAAAIKAVAPAKNLPAKVAAPVKAAPQKKDKVIVPTVIKPTTTLTPKEPAKPEQGKNKKDNKKAVETVVPTVIPSPKESAKPQQGKNKKESKKAIETVVDSTSSTKDAKVEKKTTEAQNARRAFKKAKKASKKAKKTMKKGQKVSEEKSENPAVNSVRFDPIPYDEEKFNTIVNVENVKKMAEVLKTQVAKEVAEKKSSIFDDYRYFLQVCCFKIANCPKRMVKLNLKHPLVGKDDDVLLVVPDLQRGAKADYEPTKHHYEDLLRSNGVEGITVMPMNQLRKEYSTYEQRRRLCATYDHFLCDGRIVSHVVGIVGKLTNKPRHTFHAVRLHEEKDVKGEIEKALRRTAYRQLAKSTLIAIPLATHKFTSQQIAENVVHVVEHMKKLYPGGLGNVRNLFLKIDVVGTTSLPLYMSMAQAPELTPMVVGPREERMIKLKREANEVLSKFAMTKEGKLIKLTKTEVEKKRKLQEMKAALKEDEEVPSKKAKKAKKASEVPDDKKKKGEEAKELELPENEEDDDNSSDEDDDDDNVQLEGSSDDDEVMGQLDQEEDDETTEEECETGIVENGLGDEESDEEDDEQEGDGSGDDDDGDDDDDEDDDEDAEESD